MNAGRLDEYDRTLGYRLDTERPGKELSKWEDPPTTAAAPPRR